MNESTSRHWKKVLLIAAEALLVLVIVGLLVATWMPAIYVRWIAPDAAGG